MYRQPEITLAPEEVLVYLRKSRSDDPLLSVEEVLSKHETILDEWAEKNLGGKVPEENKFREVVSGETLTERPEIQKVLKMIESPKLKAVEIIEPQRLTRGDLEDIGRIMKLLKHTNTLVITPGRIYDLRDEYDWDAFERELKRGNEFLEYTKKILNRGKLLSVSQGNYLSARPPYGYERTKVKEGNRECPTLKIKEHEANAVRIIFDLYVNKGYGMHRIAGQLDELGIKAPRGEHWSSTGVNDMLSNVHYTGKVRWNWRKTVTVVENGEFKKMRPHSKIDEQLIFDGKHEAIISDELFQAAQERLGKTPRVKKRLGLANPFAGIVVCANCGRRMTYQTLNKARGAEPPRLHCPNSKFCGMGSCQFKDFQQEVIDVLEDCIEDFEVRISNDDADSRQLHANLIKQLEAKLVDLEKKEISQWEKYSEEGMPKHIFDRLNEKVLRDKEEIKEALCKAKESMPDPVDYVEKLTTFKAAVAALKDPDVAAEEKNRLVRACVEQIKYRREKPQRINLGGQRRAFASDNVWTNPPIELDVKLKI